MQLLRHLIATAICGGVALSVAAQKSCQIGLQLGFNTGTVKYTPELTHDGTVNTGYQPGIAAGLTSSLPLGQHWSLAPSIRYLRTGFTISETVPTTNSGGQGYTAYQTTYALNRAELPVDILYFFNPSQKGIFLVAGASVGVLLGGKRTTDVSYTDGVSTGGYSVKDDIKVAETYPLGVTNYYLQRWDAGIKGGLGYQYFHISVQAFYRFGLVDIASKSALSNFPSPSIYSRMAELQVSYLFNK